MEGQRTEQAWHETGLRRHIEALKGAGLKARAQPGGEVTRQGGRRVVVDAWLRLEGGGGPQLWAAELKRWIAPTTLGPVIHQMKTLQDRCGRAVLLTEYVTPPLADELKKHGVHFADMAGNAFLEGKGLFVWVAGRRPQTTQEGRRRRLHAAGLRLLYVLLKQGRTKATYRDLADQAGIALGGVGWILRELRQRGWVRKAGPRELALLDAPAMLRRWEEGYADTLRPKLLLQTCRMARTATLHGLEAQIGKAGLDQMIRIGGELGAAILTEHLQPAGATLHLRGVGGEEVMRRLKLVPDRAGNVHLLQGFAQGEGTPDGHQGLADPLLLRAEMLIHPDDRLTEVAELVRTRHIEPRWK